MSDNNLYFLDAQCLEVLWGMGKGAVMQVLYVLRECLASHIQHVRYINSHPSPCVLQPSKYYICSMKKDLLKTPNGMCGFIYN